MAVLCVVAALRLDGFEAALHTSAMSVRAVVALFGVAWLLQARAIGRELE